MMEDIRKSIEAINILSETDLKLPLIQKDLSVMEHLLETLRVNNAMGNLAECYVTTLFQVIREDSMALKGSLDKVVKNPDNEWLKEDIIEASSDLERLLDKMDEVEKAFKPYLFCPKEMQK